MVGPQPDNHLHIQDLLAWANGASQLGISDAGLEIDRPFIPDPETEAYFKDIGPVKKLLAVLFHNGAPQLDPEIIRKKYAKVFLILLLTGNGHFIELFVRHDSLCDQYLPFRSRPTHFPNSAGDADFFKSFYRKQWEFCARIFRNETHQQFDEKDLILPIISKKKLGGGGSANVYKIELHPAYNKLGREGPSREGSTNLDTHTFVLKTYNTPDAERYYNNEVSGFSHLNYGGRTNANIIGFHGSFIRDGTYNVLLEYADRGTLEEYFNTVQPPSSGEDILKFWRELFQILRALVAIHSVQPSDFAASSDSSKFQGWHQDLKPLNIFVKSAPECYRADSDIEKLPLLVKQGVDIWSLGCIFSEAAVWVVYGRDGLSEYRRRRGVETALIPDFRDGNCFHDEWLVLDTVTKIHRTLADDIRVRDHVTGAIVDMVTKAMLIEQDSRPSAKFLSHRTKEILREAETKLGRSASYAGTGSVSGTVAQSPPRTPPEPPPGHFQSRSTNSHSRHLARHTYAGSPASTSYNKDDAHHQEPADDIFGKRASQQLHYSDWRNRRQSAGPVNHPSYAKYEDQDRFPENHLNRAFSEVGLSQDSPSSPSWQEPLDAHRRRRRTPSDLFSGANTRNGPDVSAQDRQEIYNVSQRDSFTAPLGGVSRTSTATLVQNLHNGSRAGQHDLNMASGPRPPGLSSAGSSNAPPPIETQPRRRPPFLNVTAAQQWKKDKKEHRLSPLPNAHILADLNERDHVFLIDNSSSMLSHRKEVRDLFELLAYMVKVTDPDGIEIRFTMSREKKKRKRNTAPLLRILDEVPYDGTSNIRTDLGDILQNFHAKSRNPKPMKSIFNRTRPTRPIRRQNVYILTDGVWQPSCDPTTMITKLVDSLEQNSMEREQFGIQFIRFGDDPDGINRLNQLDSGLGLSMDIVDTEPSNGNVWKMLRGAIDDWYDDDDINANSSAMAFPIVGTSPGTNSLHHFGRRFTHT